MFIHFTLIIGCVNSEVSFVPELQPKKKSPDHVFWRQLLSVHVQAHDAALHWFIYSPFSSTVDEYSPQRKVSLYDTKTERILLNRAACPLWNTDLGVEAIVLTFPAKDIVLQFNWKKLSVLRQNECVSKSTHFPSFSEQSTFPPIEPERERAPVQRHTEGDQGR